MALRALYFYSIILRDPVDPLSHLSVMIFVDKCPNIMSRLA